MPAPYTGRCLCGEVEYRLNDEPVAYYACHCTEKGVGSFDEILRLWRERQRS